MTRAASPAARIWTKAALEAVIEDARELAFVGHETMEQAVRRLGVSSAGALDMVLRDAGAHDILRQFTANKHRSSGVRW